MLDIQELVRPNTLTEAFNYLKENKWKITAGGTDILPAVRDGRLKKTCLIDLFYLKENLGKIYLDGRFLHVGALATHDEIACSKDVCEKIPALSQACKGIGSAQIRKRATLGGNLVNASPAADSVPVLLAADASVCLRSKEGERRVLINDFLKGPGKTDLKNDEILTDVLIPCDGRKWQGTYMKVGGRNALVISIAGAAILRDASGQFRVACGSVGPTVLRANRVEALFNGEEASLEKVKKALEQDICPIDDVRATGRYRKMVMANVLWNVYDHWKEGM